MKKNVLFIGILLLGISMIISSLILSKSISEGKQLNGSLNGTFDISNTTNEEGDILKAYSAGVMLGYDRDDLIKDIDSGNLQGLPFAKIGDQYVFSKKALEEWVYSKSKENMRSGD